ncbi:unnamed protein product [Caenorhabditis angaria]|uniref:Uncharacterized protein n=1 Tax=Caenorhabditis angaria TaxID=860376 RepID=A0A9P1ICJ1_9PELO|nr:unnamed protein product [Caenorhabditis angaria]
MWIEIRNLFDAISQVASFEDDKKSAEIISLIEKYKYRLSNVLSNNPKNAADKAKIVPGGKIKFDDVEITLDSSLCAESMIISDIFTLNELDSVDLILAGEAQKIHFDGINRGLIAVVCYYDAHRLLITTLRQILRWDREELPAKLVQLIDSTFIQANVVKHLFQLLNSFSVSTEFSRLMQPSVNGLGGSKHQKLLRNAIEEIRHEIITCISLICENPGGEALNIANYFFAIVKSVPLEKLNLTNMAAWLSLIKITSSEVLNQVPDATSVLNSMITHIRDETTWTDQSMCGTLQLACAVSLRALASSPADHSGIESIKVDVDLIVDRSIKNMVFQYLRHAIIRSDHFQFAHQFVVVDELLKQLVAFFPAKLMEIERNSSDELVFYDEKQKIDEKPKTGDVVATEKSAALSNYENFLRCFIDLYEMETEKTTKTAKERLLNQQIAESSSAFSTEKSMELCRLLERSRLPHHVVHAVAYLEFAAAVCKNHLTASFLYDIFARDYYGGSSDVVGWETLMTALRAYDRLFREQKNQLFSASRIQQQQQQQNKPAIDKTQIPAQELAGLIAWLRLSTKVALLDDIAAQRFSDDQSWGVLRSVASIASSSVPLPLKAALINFLTAVARLRGSAVRVWQVIHTNQLCYFAENGQLMGMQQELEERECAAKQYDVSLSFVRLVSTLISHKPLPEYSGAFIQFITRSILSQFASRSYNDIGQMWNLAEQSLKATNTLLEYGIVEPRSVANNEIHIALLSQCLNDTPLFRALARIIMEDCQAQTDPYTSKQTASSDSALIALRILSRAIVLHSALRACSRVSSSDIIVASIQALVFTPIHSSSPCTILDLVFQYLQMADDYPLHALYAARIFRDATATRGTVQGSMLELLRSRNSQSLHIRAIRTALCVSSIQYTINDSLEKEEETTNPIYARGETARIILETLSDSIDSSQKTARNEDSNNITYYLLAFRSSRGNSKELYDNDDLLTGLHYVLHIIEQFIATKSPFDLPFSALLEPAFRLMQRLVSMNCPFSKPVLCFMRSSNVIEKLVTSPFVCSALALEDEIDNTYATGVFSVRRMIAGYILHFAAVEIYAMLTTGHFTRPETLYRALLESSKLVSEYTMSEEEEEEGNDPNLLFSLLRRATIIKRFDLSYPELVHFDVNKLHELFDACLTITIYGVAQYDVAYLDKLLRREIDAVYKEGDDLKYVRKEMENVLEYCTEVNANLLSESASERIVNGCTALLNVFAAFAPVHFFSSNMQLTIFRDSCYVLIEMMSGIGGSSLVSAVQTFHRMVETVTKLAKDEYSKPEIHKYLSIH